MAVIYSDDAEIKVFPAILENLKIKSFIILNDDKGIYVESKGKARNFILTLKFPIRKRMVEEFEAIYKFLADTYFNKLIFKL